MLGHPSLGRLESLPKKMKVSRHSSSGRLISIGYVEAICATLQKLNSGSVRNRAGKYVKAEIESITTAVSISSTSGDDFRSMLGRSADPRSYLISSFT